MTDRETNLYRFEADPSLADLLDEAAGEEWTILAAIVTGEDDDGTLFVDVVRRRIGDDGQLVLRDGYAVVDPDAGDPVSWSDNYVDRRVQGSLLSALTKVYGAIHHGGATEENPKLLDSREDDVEEDPGILTDPFDVDVREDDVDTAPEKDDPRTSVEGDDPDTVECHKCGEEIPREDAENFGGGSFGDVWVHAGPCNGGEDE